MTWWHLPLLITCAGGAYLYVRRKRFPDVLARASAYSTLCIVAIAWAVGGALKGST